MTLDSHINLVSRGGYAHLRDISHIRRSLTNDTTKSLVNGLVTSHVDYCNALLQGLPKKLLHRLQLVQNTAARIITRTDHITPVLKDLHWLLIQCSLDFKVLMHVFKVLHNQDPEYMKDMLQVYKPTRTLRSQNGLTLVVPRVKTQSYGNRYFSYAASKL